MNNLSAEELITQVTTSINSTNMEIVLINMIKTLQDEKVRLINLLNDLSDSIDMEINNE